MTNMRFGKLLVIEAEGRVPQQGQILWRCICDCGSRPVVPGTFLRRGEKTSCGCASGRRVTHRTPAMETKKTWKAMLQRCLNPKNDTYADYGGRGIKVCDRWRSFDAFLQDMGERPKGCSIDRIDNDGDYCKENCCWSSATEQQQHTRQSQPCEIDGVTYTTINAAARALGIHRATLQWRFNHNAPGYRRLA